MRTDRRSPASTSPTTSRPDGRTVFLPRAALGLPSSTTADPGSSAATRRSTTSCVARSNGYVTDETVPVAVGERYLVRSRVICSRSACRSTPSSRFSTSTTDPVGRSRCSPTTTADTRDSSPASPTADHRDRPQATAAGSRREPRHPVAPARSGRGRACSTSCSSSTAAGASCWCGSRRSRPSGTAPARKSPGSSAPASRPTS